MAINHILTLDPGILLTKVDIKGSVQWYITFAYYCLDMFILSYCTQNNIFNNIIIMNFQDI